MAMKREDGAYLPEPLNLLVGGAPMMQLRVRLEVVQVDRGKATGEELQLGRSEDGDQVLRKREGGGEG